MIVELYGDVGEKEVVVLPIVEDMIVLTEEKEETLAKQEKEETKKGLEVDTF